MKIRDLKYFTFSRNELFILIVSFALGVLFGIIDSLVSTFILGKGTILDQMFASDLHVLWTRSLVMLIVVVNGFIIIGMLRRLKKSSDRLHQSEEFFQKVFRFSATGIALADLHGNFLRVNSSFCDITGFSEKELLGMNFRDITHPDDLNADLEMLKRLEKNEISYFTMEKRYLNKAGHYVWVVLNVASIRNRDGILQYYIANVNDISDRNESSFIDISEREKAIYEKNRAFQDINQIFNSIGVGLCLIDREYNIARVNDTFMQLFKRRREEIIGRKCHEIMHETICGSADCPLEKIVGGDAHCAFESEKVVEKSSALTLRVTANPFVTHAGEILGIILSFTDISENRMLEKSLAEISEKERQSLGQLLHDEIGQLLTGLTFRTEALKNIMKEKSYPEVQDVDEMSSLVKKIHAHVRRIMIGIFPVSDRHDRFLVSITDLAAETEKFFNIRCNVETRGALSFSDHSDITQLVYIARESVNNAVKHAAPRHINIKLSSENGIFTMEIENDIGKTEKLNTQKSGLGLRIMQYRAKLIGAKFEYLNRMGTFTVRVSKPLLINS